VTSDLVFLDLTVVDKNGKPVTQGLTQDDFKITENGKPQRIFSFEAPEVHVMPADSKEDDPDGKAPAAIFVVDRLNSKDMDDFERGRKGLLSYLNQQPEELNSPAEIMLLNNTSLEMIQGYTRSKADLIWAVEHIQPGISFKAAKSDFDGERAHDSISALMELAVQNLGVPGRKNIFWIGPGGPSLSRAAYGPELDRMSLFYHAAIDLLVDSRISLFVTFPGLKTEQSSLTLGSLDSDDRSSNIGNNNLKTGDINFALFALQTGGGLFYNRNDTGAEIVESRELGAHYFTLTYQPTDHNFDGKYRRIDVKIDKPGLRVVTKQGYFALDRNGTVEPQQRTISNITHAASSTIPYTSLNLRVSDVVRNPDSHTAQLVLHIQPKNLGWKPAVDGKKTAELLMGITSLSANRKILAWKFEHVNLQSPAADPDQIKDELRVRITANLPSKTQSIRVVLETADAGRIGTADVDRGTLEAAPAVNSTPKSGIPGSAASLAAPAHN
jgi:VWFA-related protein